MGKTLAVDASMEGLPSIAFDAVFVPGGAESIKALSRDGVALHYVLEAYKHLKAIGLHSEARQLLVELKLEVDAGLIEDADASGFFRGFFRGDCSASGLGAGAEGQGGSSLKRFVVW
nr:hypothetical protein GCM10020185_32550 [Pseudomonas brassicacearum subsp. brassicacearum]